MTGLVMFVAYAAGVVIAARLLGLRVAAYCLSERPELYPGGRFVPDGDDVFIVALSAVVWPAGLPIGWLMTRTSESPPIRWAAPMFGTRPAADDREQDR